jgi:hypothetical protein
MSLPPPPHCVPSTALCPLYGPLSSLFDSMSALRPCASCTALYPLYGLLSPAWASVRRALCPLYIPLPSLLPSILSKAQCFFNILLSHLMPSEYILYSPWPYVPSTALCLSMALCPLYGPMPLYDSLSPFTVLCPICCPLSAVQHFSFLWPSLPSTLLKKSKTIM